MGIRTRITAEAKAHGMTAAELARRLGWYRSNLSAMDAGRRTVSIRALARLSEILGCGPGDLLELSREAKTPLFRDARLNARLQERDAESPDGAEKGWLHAAQFAWRRHYAGRKRTA